MKGFELKLYDFNDPFYYDKYYYHNLDHAYARIEKYLREFVEYEKRCGGNPEWYDVDTWEELIDEIINNKENELQDVFEIEEFHIHFED